MSADSFMAPVSSIRTATRHDVAELARLLTALGHPTSADSIEACWDEWSAAGNVALVAAGADGTLAGVVTLHRMLALHRPRPVGRITALIVDEAMRGQGIGRRLAAAAEDAFVRAGCGLIEVTSNARRLDAHAFYERIGYARTSIRFAKVPETPPLLPAN